MSGRFAIPSYAFAGALPALLLLALLWSPASATAASGDDAEAWLERSVAYHDPEGVWGRSTLTLHMLETRPAGQDRRTEIRLDPIAHTFERITSGERELKAYLGADGECTFRLDGSEEIPQATREELRLDCKRLAMLRNYYDYLWGLPMKLRDPGTRLAPEAPLGEFEGREARVLKVTYEPEVGSDIWYFYLDPQSARLIGYRFYHDEEKGDGEYILLEGETRSAELRLPARRAWYTHQGRKHLGTDILNAIQVE